MVSILSDKYLICLFIFWHLLPCFYLKTEKKLIFDNFQKNETLTIWDRLNRLIKLPLGWLSLAPGFR